MATSEERREVAASLRIWAKTDEYLDRAIVRTIYEILPSDRRPCAEILADLIEPQERTCHNVSDYKFGNFRCSECGCFWPNYFNEEHNFCPGCGARITEVDDDK